MIKLTKIRLINWHYLSNETIEVKDNILLTGQNASGKSTILDALTFILTGGDTTFNLAANEKGKRDLKSYVKCKLGAEDKEYLRDGDVTGHIALEFHNEALDSYFVLGAVIDAVGDIGPAKSNLYRANQRLDDSMFLDGKHIYSIMEFKKAHRDFDIYSTKQEAKRGFRNAFGSINEDYFKLIIKALAFKPIADVKDFIYQNILEEKEIDVSSIKDSIRSYKELEQTLNMIKGKIAKLKEIDETYTIIEQFEEEKNYYEYLMKLFEVEGVKSDIASAQNKIVLLEEERSLKAKALSELDGDNEHLNERKDELYKILSNSEEFKAEEYVNSQLDKATREYESVKDSKDIYIKKAAAFKETVNELRKIDNKKIYAELANLPLTNVTNFDSEKTKLTLIDINNRLENTIDELNVERGALNSDRQAVLNEIAEINTALKGLDNNKLRYNPKLLSIRSDIEAGLKSIYGYDVSVHFFAELIEIEDKTWADTIEIFLGNRRFDMIVEPKYYDTALSVYARIKNKYNYYGTGLVNTKQINKFKSFEKNSLASIMSSENVDAQYYINMTCGNVIMCADEHELEKYNTAITNDGLIYRGYTVRALNPNIDKPFIGANAVQEQQELWNTRANESKARYFEINNQMQMLMDELSLVKALDFDTLLEELDNTIKTQTLEIKIADLKKQKANSKLGVSDVKTDYDKTIATIKSNEAKKVEINQEIGGIRISIGQNQERIVSLENDLKKYQEELASLAKDNILIENKAKDEFDEIAKSANPTKSLDLFETKLRNQQSLYSNQCDALYQKQFKYASEYNSTLGSGLHEMKKYRAELDKLEKSELISYEKKVRTARESAEIIFKEDFLSKLRDNIRTAESEIAKINETLSTIKFGNDTYEFIFPKSSEYSAFYDMVTNDENLGGESLFSTDFEIKYEVQLEELFATIAQDEENSNGAMNKFTDYRTYMDYDIKISDGTGQTMLYSKVFKSRSGGETQVPFYVAIIAAFVRIFQNNKVGVKDTIGLVMFDEVFDKMDFPRMRAMMRFISSMPIQLILACPQSAERIEVLQEYTTTTMIMVKQNTRSQAYTTIMEPIANKIENDEDLVEEA